KTVNWVGSAVLPRRRRPVQRRETRIIDVRVRAVVEQKQREIDFTSQSGDQERSQSARRRFFTFAGPDRGSRARFLARGDIVGLGSKIYIHASGKQDSNHLGVALARGEMQDGKS